MLNWDEWDTGLRNEMIEPAKMVEPTPEKFLAGDRDGRGL